LSLPIIIELLRCLIQPSLEWPITCLAVYAPNNSLAKLEKATLPEPTQKLRGEIIQDKQVLC